MNKQLCELLRRMGEAEVQHGRGRQLRQSVVMVMAMAVVMAVAMAMAVATAMARLLFDASIISAMRPAGQ